MCSALRCVVLSFSEASVDSNCIFNTLQPGTALVASGYCLYSSSCLFVFTVGNGVNGFTYDRSIGEFVLTHPNIQVSSIT